MSGIIRYAPRHVADLLITRSLAIIGVSFVFMLPISFEPSFDRQSTAELANGLGEILLSVGVFFTIIATFGLVGEDIRQGYYRFIFAKPISPVRYYAMSFGAAAIAFTVGVLGAIGLFALLIRPVWPGMNLVELFADFALLGALVLLFSRVAKFDWLLAVLFIGVASFARHRFPRDESAVGQILNILLPPTDTGRLFRRGELLWDPLTHQLLYAAAMFAIALVIVRKIPMGSAR